MAEPKDYVSILWRDRSWISDDPKKFLENLKNRLIEEGAKPGTQEYSDAFMSVMGMHADAAKRGQNIQAGGLTLFPFQGGLAAENYLNKNMTVDQIGKELGLNAINLGIGKDVKGASRNQAGEVILANDPYSRSRTGEREFDAQGRPLYRGGVGTIQNINDPRNVYKLSDFETVPDWALDVFGPQYNRRELPGGRVEGVQRDIPAELVAMGFKPGAKVTPEMVAAYDEYTLSRMSPELYSQVTGQPYGPGYDLQGNYIGTGAGAGAGTGAGSGAGAGSASTMANTTMRNPFTPGSAAAITWDQRKSAYDLLFAEFSRYGLGGLVQDIQSLVTEGISPSEFSIRLRQTEGYKRRFAANSARIARGLTALNEAQYIALEDQYQDVMRRYGLPQSYYARGEMGRQEGFEKFISQDVSPVELEDRIQTAYNRVINANPEVSIALRNFYPGISNGDILAYALDPDKALDEIKRKITAAEIGGAAVQAGLTTNESDAAYLARYGITREQAQAGYRTISGFLPRAQQLSSIYGRQVEGGPYTQASAEREIFSVPGAAEEERKRQRLTSLEQAAFSGSSGLTGGALGRERAGQF